MEGKLEAMYSPMGRASIPPKRLLKGMLLIALYSIRSERLFCEELNYNLLYRWFLNMGMDEPSFHATTFSKNRERFLEHEVAWQVFAAVVVLLGMRKRGKTVKSGLGLLGAA
jgi:transposase